MVLVLVLVETPTVVPLFKTAGSKKRVWLCNLECDTHGCLYCIGTGLKPLVVSKLANVFSLEKCILTFKKTACIVHPEWEINIDIITICKSEQP